MRREGLYFGSLPLSGKGKLRPQNAQLPRFTPRTCREGKSQSPCSAHLERITPAGAGKTMPHISSTGDILGSPGSPPLSGESGCGMGC